MRRLVLIQHQICQHLDPGFPSLPNYEKYISVSYRLHIPWYFCHSILNIPQQNLFLKITVKLLQVKIS